VSFVSKLSCSKCGKEYNLDEKVCICANKDDGRLDVFYDYQEIADQLTRSELTARPSTVWKYREFLPVQDYTKIVTLDEGGTPLCRSLNLADAFRMRSLYLKDETRNPTGSYKDRSMTVGVSKAIEFGAKTVVTASSGNAAASLAALSAKAGLDCYAFVLEAAGKGKIAQLLLYGARVVKAKGLERGEDPAVKLLKEAIDHYDWYPCPGMGPFNPYQVEGTKTIAYEVVEQLDWKVPDWIVIPVGSGCLLTGVWKGFKDFQELGYIDKLPRIAGIQSSGNAPLVRAFKQNKRPSEIEIWEHPNTIASGISDPFPWDGDAALVAIRETNGVAEDVSDERILEAEKLLASKEGIFAEPTGVAALAGLEKLLEEGVIDATDKAVVLVTGSGLKDPEIVNRLFKEPPAIEPSFKELEKILQAL